MYISKKEAKDDNDNPQSSTRIFSPKFLVSTTGSTIILIVFFLINNGRSRYKVADASSDDVREYI